MSNFRPGEVEAIKAIRAATGLGLREAMHALQQHGSAEKAVEALSNPVDVVEYESVITRALRQAELYRALRDSGRLMPRHDDCGWVTNDHPVTFSAEEMDKAAANLIPQLKAPT
jgi:hypothetical protein